LSHHAIPNWATTPSPIEPPRHPPLSHHAIPRATTPSQSCVIYPCSPYEWGIERSWNTHRISPPLVPPSGPWCHLSCRLLWDSSMFYFLSFINEMKPNFVLMGKDRLLSAPPPHNIHFNPIDNFFYSSCGVASFRTILSSAFS
jgi:hypothetical protein